MSDLIDDYSRKGLISDPTRRFRHCDGCQMKFNPDDLHTRDVDRYGEHHTLELCDECNTQDEPGKIDYDALDNLDLEEPITNRPQDGRICNCEDAPCCGCYTL